jgi:hypothetical protein
VPANIYIYFRSDEDDDRDREDFAEAIEAFFGDAAEDCGAGTGDGGFNLDYELAEGEDPHAWSDRLKVFLAGMKVPRGTAFTTFPENWETGTEWRCVCVYGQDQRVTDDPVMAVPGITSRCP